MSLLTGLVSHWKFDEASGNASDSTASANTLTNNNTVAYGTGKLNNGADFEAGSSESFSIADNASLSITGAMSTNFWINHESLPAANATRVYHAKNNGVDQISWRLAYRDDTAGSGNVGLTMSISADGANIPGTSPIYNWVPSLATFYMVTMVYDPTISNDDLRVVFYIDGSAVTLTAGADVPSSIFNGTSAFRVGDDDAGSSLFLDGIMDELSLWSRALSAGEVSRLYNGGAGLAYESFGGGPKVMIF